MSKNTEVISTSILLKYPFETLNIQNSIKNTSFKDIFLIHILNLFIFSQIEMMVSFLVFTDDFFLMSVILKYIFVCFNINVDNNTLPPRTKS